MLAQCPEFASDERIGVGGQTLFPQPRHERGGVRRLCPGYPIRRCWSKSPKHRDKAAALLHGLADRRVLVAGIVPRPMQVSQIGDASRGCFDHAPSPRPRKRSRLGQLPALRCTAGAIGLVLRSVSMDAQVEIGLKCWGAHMSLLPINPPACKIFSRDELSPRPKITSPGLEASYQGFNIAPGDNTRPMISKLSVTRIYSYPEVRAPRQASRRSVPAPRRCPTPRCRRRGRGLRPLRTVFRSALQAA